MAISFSCPCGKTLQTKEDLSGKRVRCPVYANILVVPQPTSRPVPVALPAVPGVEAYQAKPPRAQRPPAAPRPEPEPDPEPSYEPRRKRKRGKSRKLLLLAVLLSVPLLFMGLAAGGLAWWYLSPSGLTNEVQFMPDDFEMLASINVPALNNGELYEAIKKELTKSFPDLDQKTKQFEKDVGLEMGDVRRASMGMEFPRRDLHGPPDIMIVIKTRRAVELTGVFNGPQFGPSHEFKIGSYSVRQFSSDLAVCVPESKTILVGPPDVMTRVLKRDKQVAISEGMQEAMKKADYRQAVAVAVSMRGLWKDALKGTNLRQEIQREANIDPEVLTQLFDMSITHVRIGSNVEIEAQVLGTDFKGMYSVSIKAALLARMIGEFSKAIENIQRRANDFGPPPNLKGDWKGMPPNTPSSGVLVTGFPVAGMLAKGSSHYVNVTMKAGKTYWIDLKSSQFDSFLRLRNTAGTIVAMDDDSGGGLDARIVFRCLNQGTYQIEATSLGGQGGGAFVLEVREQ